MKRKEGKTFIILEMNHKGLLQIKIYIKIFIFKFENTK